MRYVLTLVAAVLGLAFINASSALAAEEEVGTKVVEGWIHSVDLEAGSFVLGGKDETQTTFRFGVKTGEREATILLDGKKANAQTAIKPGRKASVAYVEVGDDLWVTKMEVTSAAKDPDKEPDKQPDKEPDREK